MSKSPYYDVYITSSNRKLSELISTFTYEECIEEDDLVRFTMHDLNKEFIDATDFVEGAIITYQFGYLSYKITNAATAVIKSIKIKYGQTIDIDVVALDRGNQMKQGTSNKIWKNQKASDIVSTIVSRYGLTLISNATKKTYLNLPQGNRTDFEFIRYLTTIEDGGTYIFFVRDQLAYFVQRDLKKDPTILYVYGDPEGTSKVISFDVHQNDDGKNKAKTQTTVAGIDPLTKEEIKAQAAGAEPPLGDYSVNAIGDLTDLPGVDASNTTGKDVPMPVKSVQDAKDVAAKAQKDAALDAITATLVTEGDTLIKAGDIIGMSGVAKKHQGNWYTKKVKHSINDSGYMTTSDLQKNATKQPVTMNSDKLADGNDKTASKDPNGTKTLLIIKADGTIVDPDNPGQFVKLSANDRSNKYPTL